MVTKQQKSSVFLPCELNRNMIEFQLDSVIVVKYSRENRVAWEQDYSHVVDVYQWLKPSASHCTIMCCHCKCVHSKNLPNCYTTSFLASFLCTPLMYLVYIPHTSLLLITPAH